MTLTNLFYYIALGVSSFFTICALILLISYFTIYEKVNKNFRKISND